MMPPGKILIFQTAFLGDLVLTLPLIQVARRNFLNSRIAVVAIPAACESLMNHPAIDEIIPYDKRGSDTGLKGIMRMVRRLRKEAFDLAIVPHRSIRSALITRLAGIPRRIGFSTSAGRFLFTDVVTYQNVHETQRNLSLLEPLGIRETGRELPSLFPSEEDIRVVDELMKNSALHDGIAREQLVAIAPGSVWNTKRWPSEYFVSLCNLVLKAGNSVVLIGGEGDRLLCGEINRQIGGGKILNAAGDLTVLQSAEVIRRSGILVSNDSAPMHLGVAMRTPVVVIYGATVPAFGFAPLGERDVVMETHGLPCRPCSIHGGNVCPIRTFICMKNILPENVFAQVESLLSTDKQKWA